jgi:hypothetical protein
MLRAFFKNSSVGGPLQKGTMLYRVWRNDRWFVGNKKFGVVTHLIVAGGAFLYFSTPITANPCN